MKRDTVIQTLDTLGDEFDTEKLIEKLLFLEKVEQGLKEANDDKLVAYENVKQQFIEKWQK